MPGQIVALRVFTGADNGKAAMIRLWVLDERLRELAIRHAAFAWLDRERAMGNETFTQESTSDLYAARRGTSWPMPTQRRHLEARLQLTAALSDQDRLPPRRR